MIKYRILLDHEDLLESTLNDSHEISNAILESVEGKSLAELEQSLHQLQLSSIHQPHSEKHLTVLYYCYLLFK